MISKEAINISINNPIGNQIITWIIALVGPALGAGIAFWGANKIRIQTELVEQMKRNKENHSELLRNINLFKQAAMDKATFKSLVKSTRHEYSSEVGVALDALFQGLKEGKSDMTPLYDKAEEEIVGVLNK